MKAKKKYDKGGKITIEMVDAEDSKVKNSANANAKRISEALKSGVTLKTSGFPKRMTAAERKSLENDLAQTQKVLSSKASSRDIGTSYSKGGMMPKYKKGGKMSKMDFNKDGKITRADFIMMARANKKKKKK
tara:strand:+ start:896 stop:1291 length:396 start_codon:yes stop_codon:yes gene_type:complete